MKIFRVPSPPSAADGLPYFVYYERRPDAITYAKTHYYEYDDIEDIWVAEINTESTAAKRGEVVDALTLASNPDLSKIADWPEWFVGKIVWRLMDEDMGAGRRATLTADEVE